MEYCFLGGSGLEVARLGMGAEPFGTRVDEKAARRITDMYADAGGNVIDTANFYGGGLRGSNAEMAGPSERTVGKVVKGRRDRFVIQTKGYWTMEDEVRPNNVGLSRAYLTTQIEASLHRLGTDYIDLYQCHFWDFYTPVEETVRVLDDFVKAGKIRYVGVSNWDGWHVVKGNSIAKSAGLTPIVSNQIWYSIADRVAEFSVIPACRDQDVSIIAWGALAGGFLSGRYRRGAEGPRPGSGFEVQEDDESTSWKRLAIERNWATLDVMDRVAESYGKTVSNIALRWLLQSGSCDVALFGFSSIQQVSDTLAALEFSISDEDMKELTDVSELPKPYPNSFLELFGRRTSEFYGGLRIDPEAGS